MVFSCAKFRVDRPEKQRFLIWLEGWAGLYQNFIFEKPFSRFERFHEGGYLWMVNYCACGSSFQFIKYVEL